MNKNNFYKYRKGDFSLNLLKEAMADYFVNKPENKEFIILCGRKIGEYREALMRGDKEALEILDKKHRIDTRKALLECRKKFIKVYGIDMLLTLLKLDRISNQRHRTPSYAKSECCGSQNERVRATWDLEYDENEDKQLLLVFNDGKFFEEEWLCGGYASVEIIKEYTSNQAVERLKTYEKKI